MQVLYTVFVIAYMITMIIALIVAAVVLVTAVKDMHYSDCRDERH